MGQRVRAERSPSPGASRARRARSARVRWWTSSARRGASHFVPWSHQNGRPGSLGSILRSARLYRPASEAARFASRRAGPRRHRSGSAAGRGAGPSGTRPASPRGDNGPRGGRAAPGAQTRPTPPAARGVRPRGAPAAADDVTAVTCPPRRAGPARVGPPPVPSPPHTRPAPPSRSRPRPRSRRAPSSHPILAAVTFSCSWRRRPTNAGLSGEAPPGASMPAGPGRARGRQSLSEPLRGAELGDGRPGRAGPISSAGRMSPIEMFVQGEAPAPEPHPRGGRRRLGPGRRCRGKHRTHTLILGRAAAWARLPLRRRDGTGPGAPAAGSRPPAAAAACLPAALWVASRARRARGRHPAASRERRALPTPCPPRAPPDRPRAPQPSRAVRGAQVGAGRALGRSAGPDPLGLRIKNSCVRRSGRWTIIYS